MQNTVRTSLPAKWQNHSVCQQAVHVAQKCCLQAGSTAYVTRWQQYMQSVRCKYGKHRQPLLRTVNNTPTQRLHTVKTKKYAFFAALQRCKRALSHIRNHAGDRIQPTFRDTKKRAACCSTRSACTLFVRIYLSPNMMPRYLRHGKKIEFSKLN